MGNIDVRPIEQIEADTLRAAAAHLLGRGKNFQHAADEAFECGADLLQMANNAAAGKPLLEGLR